VRPGGGARTRPREGARTGLRKRFGQHFLHDPGVIRRIVAAIAPAPGEEIVEIGPGQGALTRPLFERAGRLTAIEIDRDLAAELTGVFRSHELKILREDALKLDYASFPSGFRLVGNLPYNISTPLLFHLSRSARHARDLHFMLQLEVVERMVAAPSTPEYGRLSVALQTRFEMKKLFDVAPGCFRPPPKVDSAVVRLFPLKQGPDCDEEIFDDLLRRAFSARRKTLRNALGLKDEAFAALGIDPGLRPENLSPADYLRIARQAG
jgi:16S rRNA (adenine1518-N6/adenine1519-N6)-dimethyltransferase